MSTQIGSSIAAAPNSSKLKRIPSVLPPLSRIPTARPRSSADPMAKLSLQRTPTSGRLICSPPPLSARLRTTTISDSYEDELEFFSTPHEETGTATPAIRLSPCPDAPKNTDTLDTSAHDLLTTNTVLEATTSSMNGSTIEPPTPPRLTKTGRSEKRNVPLSAKRKSETSGSKLASLIARDAFKHTLELPPRLLTMTATASDGQSIETLQELSQQKSFSTEASASQLPPIPSTKISPKLPIERETSPLDRRLLARSAMSRYMPLQPIKSRKSSDP